MITIKNKYKEGYTSLEIRELLNLNPEIDSEKFFSALKGCTGMIKDGHMITYHCDVDLAIKCCLENRDPKPWEVD